MATFWITFRLADEVVDGRDYATRYKALIDALTIHRGSGWWYEPTSFWLMDSSSTRIQLAAAAKAAVAPSKDLVVVGSLGYPGVSVVGKSDDLNTLRHLAPGLDLA